MVEETTTLGVDEERVLSRLRARLELGRERYGELVFGIDRRDWRKEAMEEVLDLAIYSAIALEQRDELLAAVDEVLERMTADVENAWQGVGMMAVPIRALIKLKLVREEMRP